MAIAFDAGTNGGVTAPGTTLSWTHTVGAITKGALFVLVYSTNDNITGVTCDGVPMLLINKNNSIPFGTGAVALYYITNVQPGSRSIVATVSSSSTINGLSASYAGVDPGMTIFGSKTDNTSTKGGSGTGANITASVTTIMKNSWTILIGYQTGGSALTAGAGSTLRVAGSQVSIFDSNGTVGVGSTSMTVGISGTSNGGGVVMSSFSPAQSSYADVAASLVTSAYKWLTQTLYNAQNAFAVRPYFTAQIFDDTIQPSAQFFSGSGNPPTPNLNCGADYAPDGTVFAAGIDGSGNLKVWSSSQLHAVAGIWDNVQTLSTGGDGIINDSRNIVAVRCSPWYKGTYQVYVWYYANFANDGTNLTIKCQRSDDAGVHWTEINFAPGSLPNNAINNLALAPFTPVFQYDPNNLDFDMFTGVFYIKKTGSYYDIYYIYGTTHGYSTDVKWTHNANSGDWTIHSLGAFRLNGFQHVVISGYHNIIETAPKNANYSLWVTKILNNVQSNTSDLWSQATPILPVGAASATNQNSFTFPSAQVITNNNKTLVYITCQAVLNDSLTTTPAIASGSTVSVTTHTNYMLLVSDDGSQFSYPSIIVGTDGTEFNNGAYANLVKQGKYLYAIGAGYVWELIQSNATADISSDVIAYNISEAAGQPSSLTLQVSNANNKWYGGTPTGLGASAIARNRKMLITQGYYNANGVPESVPRNVYYIDDIQQNVSGTKNDLSITGRDWFKKLKTTVTRFSYQFVGPTFFADIFDGTFFSSWNQIAASWSFISNVNPPLLEGSGGSAGTITLVTSNGNSYGSHYRVSFRSPPTTPNPNHFFFYAIYIDANNWLRLDLDMFGGTAWKVTKNVGGVQTDMDSGSLPHTIADNHYHSVYIRRYDYFKFNFMVSIVTSVTVGNDISEYDPATISYVTGSGNGEFDLTGTFSSPFTVGMGFSGTGLADFRFFAFSQFNNPNNLASVMRSVARIAGIFDFKFTNTWREYFFTPNFTGFFTKVNRKLAIPSGTQAIEQSHTFSNGEIDFTAQVSVPDPTVNAGFSFIFRKSNDETGQDDYYKFHIFQESTGFSNPPTFCRFERFIKNTGKTYRFYNTPDDVSNNPQKVGRLGVDITKSHRYRVFMIDGWMYAFIDDQMVASFADTNSTYTFQTTGNWGFEADANTLLTVEKIEAPDFWKPVQTFSFNPGDDAEQAIDGLFSQLRAWMFSDLFGRFKAKFLNTTDASTYTYQNQLFQQNTDNSDKEYVAQVTVIGNGVSATARNTNLFAGAPTRDLVITDFTISLVADAQTRANNELINANQYINQYMPKQVINLGSEVFDPITIVNTGNNTTGVNNTTRVYAQTINVGGGGNNSDYSIELDTGSL